MRAKLGRTAVIFCARAPLHQHLTRDFGSNIIILTVNKRSALAAALGARQAACVKEILDYEKRFWSKNMDVSASRAYRWKL